MKLIPGPHRAIKTEYKGPTNTKGGRIIATVLASGKRFTIPWDHALGIIENHDTAAVEACRRMEWDGALRGASMKGGGYVYVLAWKEEE